MPIESPADRLTFLSAGDFGVVATYSQNGSAIQLPGIFDRQHLSLEVGDAAVTGVSVTFVCRADDLAVLPFQKARQDDSLTVSGQNWKVVEAQPDGTGMVMLMLRKP